MSRRKFDRYMVVAGAGNHVKFARLTDGERCAHFLGVLSIAAQAPIRGCLLVGDQEAEAVEIAHEARVAEKVALSALAKLKAIGVLERDDDLGCWRVHDWDDVNPAPKEDATAAERSKRYRDKRKARDANGAVTDTVTPTVTPASRRDGRDANGAVTDTPSRECVAGTRAKRAVPEGVEEEVEVPPNPRRGKASIAEEKAVALGFAEWLEDHHKVTGKTTPAPGTKTRATLASRYVDCCAELPAEWGQPLSSMKLATRGAHGNEHRVQNGYDGAENVLRVTKILGLVDNGRRLAKSLGPVGGGPGSVSDIQAAMAKTRNAA
jgi:hypothetical protein